MNDPGYRRMGTKFKTRTVRPIGDLRSVNGFPLCILKPSAIVAFSSHPIIFVILEFLPVIGVYFLFYIAFLSSGQWLQPALVDTSLRSVATLSHSYHDLWHLSSAHQPPHL